MKTLVCSEAIHDALKSDPAAWASLPLVGVVRMEYGDGGPDEIQEARNCHCRSTLVKCTEVQP